MLTTTLEMASSTALYCGKGYFVVCRDTIYIFELRSLTKALRTTATACRVEVKPEARNKNHQHCRRSKLKHSPNDNGHRVWRVSKGPRRFIRLALSSIEVKCHYQSKCLLADLNIQIAHYCCVSILYYHALMARPSS
jgi:hypothetical protein